MNVEFKVNEFFFYGLLLVISLSPSKRYNLFRLFDSSHKNI